MNNSSSLRALLAEYLGLTLVLIVLVAVFGLSTNNFFTPATFRMIANQIPVAILLAVGMTLVLSIGCIDLSVGSVLAWSGSAFGLLLVKFQLPWPVALLGCLATGLVCGAFNAGVTVYWGLPSFIVTLGMLEIARGGAQLELNSQTMYIPSGLHPFSDLSVAGLSGGFVLAVVLALASQVVLQRTVLGRYMIAIGTNEEVVRLSGISTWPIKLLVFMASGLLASLASVILCSRMSAADPNAGSGFELQAIAAVVIGGTSLMGGRASVVNSLFGVVIIAVLETGLVQVGAGEPTKRIITGLVIVVAVIIDRYRHREK